MVSATIFLIVFFPTVVILAETAEGEQLSGNNIRPQPKSLDKCSLNAACKVKGPGEHAQVETICDCNFNKPDLQKCNDVFEFASDFNKEKKAGFITTLSTIQYYMAFKSATNKIVTATCVYDPDHHLKSNES